MNFYFSSFIEGVNDALVKSGYDQVFNVNGEIFPNISSQTKWQFARTPTHINLNDGANVYSFHMPEGCKHDEDYPLVKQTGVSLNDFGKDALVKGTAQVHRANPGCIYFTLQDGRTNPTLHFKHIEGDSWRAMPKVKKHKEPVTAVHESAFLKGVEDKVAQYEYATNILNFARNAGKTGVKGLLNLGNHPMLSAGAGLAAGAAYDLGKRNFYNSEEENAAETPGQRLRRYVLPAAGAGLGGALLRNTFPHEYDVEAPIWRPK